MNCTQMACRLAAAAGLAVLALAHGAAAEPAIQKSVKVAPGLYELAVDAATKTVYVASIGPRGSHDAKIVKLDTATLEPKGAIALGNTPAFGVGLDARTETLYGTSTILGVLSVIDLKSGTVVGKISHGERAHLREVVVDQESGMAYASRYGTAAQPERPAREPGGRAMSARPATPGEIWAIDGKTKALAYVIELGNRGVMGLALDKANNRLYATDLDANEVLVIDLAKRAMVAHYPTGGKGPINLVFDATGGRLFAANSKSGDVSVLAAQDGTLLKTVKTGAGALGIALHPTAKALFVANRGAGTVSVIDTERLEKVADLETGTLPQSIAIDRTTGLVYVTNKARGLPRNAPRDAVPPDDPQGDTVTIIHP
jgi:YVTN family beta-propeller protein